MLRRLLAQFGIRYIVIPLADGFNGTLDQPLSAPNGLVDVLDDQLDLELLVRFARADCTGRAGTFDCSGIEWFIERATALGVEHRPPAPILLGRHLIELGVKPGPEMGDILKAVYEQQLDGGVTTLDQAMAQIKIDLKLRLAELREQVNIIPLHRQVVPWGARASVTAVHRPDNWLELAWVKISP